MINKLTFVSLALIYWSCDWGAQLQQIKEDNEELKSTVQSYQKQLDLLLIETRCKSPKVLGFLKDCKEMLAGGTGQCSRVNVEQAMKFMREEPHVVIRMWPKHGIDRISENRRNQLGQLLAPSQVTSVSNVLIIVQPQSERPEHSNEAMRWGRLLKRQLHDTYRVSESSLFGPLPVTCRGKSQLLDWYSRVVPDDRPDNEEPRARDPQIAAWVFRLDCGHVATAPVDRTDRSTSR